MTHWPTGDGGMARRIREHAWADTPLGPAAGWPQALRTAVGLMLASGHAMQLAWGPERTLLYNDAYAPMLGDRHPGALGLPFCRAWPDIWPQIEPLVARVFAGETVTFADLPLVMTRRGFPEDTWWNFSYSPVRDEAGAVAGLLNVTVDATGRVRAERAERERDEAHARLRASEEKQTFLLALSDALRPLALARDVQGSACRLLAEHLAVDRAYYVEIDEARGVATVDSDHVRAGAPSLAGVHPIADFAWSVEILRRGACHLVDDARRSPVVPDAARGALLGLGIVACMGAPLIKGGRLVGALCVAAAAPRAWGWADIDLVRDVGERIWAAVGRARAEAALRRSEELFRTLVQGIPHLIWRGVGEGLWTWASPQWTAYTGQPEPESRGLGWLDPVHPDDRGATMAAWGAAAALGRFEAEYRLRGAGEGRYRWFQTRATPVRDGGGAIVEWLGASTDVDDLRRLQEGQAVMVTELQHRTRNLIAVVRGIADDTMGETGPTEAFRAAFFDRLAALSRVQGLLSRSEAEPITIGALVRLELDALGADDGRVSIGGPEAFLRPSTVQTLALALHELATNARKHGALSHGRGRLAVTWCEREEGGEPRLALDWVESGREHAARQPAPPGPGDGYGRELIERALPHAMGARTAYALTASGLRCSLDIPVRPGRV